MYKAGLVVGRFFTSHPHSKYSSYMTEKDQEKQRIIGDLPAWLSSEQHGSSNDEAASASPEMAWLSRQDHVKISPEPRSPASPAAGPASEAESRPLAAISPVTSGECANVSSPNIQEV
jgi:hypothetical protein